MKRTAITVLLFLLAVLLPASSKALEMVHEKGKPWERTIHLGWKIFPEEQVHNAPNIGIRLLKRITYPLLIGLEVQGSYIDTANDDAWYMEFSLPVALRAPFYRSAKIDILMAPGIAYLTNAFGDDFEGTATAGFETKAFVKEGLSIGVGAYYSMSTNSDLNNWRFSLLLGF
jgi:hypothetical protein